MSNTEEMDASAAPLIEHLKELRSRILVSVAVLTVACMIGYLLWKPIFDILSLPMCNALEARGEKCQFVLIKLQEGFFVAMKIAVWAGFAMSFPVLAHQMWRFVAPGLYRNEKSAFLPFMFASPVMFLIGAAFAYYLILPGAFAFFLSYQ
jgi:sec-independent protein translocase protein TatC